jgi:hypothetical protein
VWLVLALMPARARGYARTTASGSSGACLYWGPRTVHYLISKGGLGGVPIDQLTGSLEAGFNAWVGWGCTDFAFADDGPTASVQVGYNRVLVTQPALAADLPNEHLVVFREKRCLDIVPAGDDCAAPGNDDCDNKYNCWADRSNGTGDVLAYTLVTSETGSGRILDADTAFDASDFQFRDLSLGTCDATVDAAHCADIQNTMAHEAGHFLGLAHSQETTATMYFQVVSTYETTKRNTSPDDVDGLCAIYPAGRPPVTCVPSPPVEISAQGCGCHSGDGLAFWPLLGALLRVAKRRRLH